MKLPKEAFQVLDLLDNHNNLSQRQIAKRSGISLGQVNFVIKSFVQKGLVKLHKFNKNPNKSGYLYLLTPKGIEAKSRIAVRFVSSKLQEYQELRQKITHKILAIESDGVNKIIFVGPVIVKDSILSIIKENSMELDIVGFCHSWKELSKFSYESFNIALLFDGSTDSIITIAKKSGIPQEKLTRLW